MGRGRVQLRRIENKIRRQVTFSKRRTGLVKKAQEISVLCDAEVALIVFSTKGKLFDYSAGSSMEKIIDRYERHPCAGKESLEPILDSQGDCSVECSRLLRMIDVLQRNIRYLKGEEVDALSVRELQSLEMQTETALKRTRSRKHQLLLESIAQLHKKEKELKERNNQLTKEKMGIQQTDQSKESKQQNLSQNSPSSVQQPPPPPYNLGSTLHGMESGEPDVGSLIRPANKMILPHWMPRQV